jgi:hypothetical protein
MALFSTVETSSASS